MSLASQVDALAARIRDQFNTVHGLVLFKAQNLSDVANAGTARTNLGLGTAATKNITVGTAAPSSPAVNDLWVDTN